MDSLNESTNILIKNITDDFLASLKQQITKMVTENIAGQIAQLDVGSLAREHLTNLLGSNAKTFNFPDRSIKGSSIQPDGLWIRGDQIAGGTIRNFESTGIQDRASQCQVTILDNATVYENQLVAKELHIAGDAVVVGNLTVSGSVNKDCQLFKDVLDHSLESLRGEMKDGMLSSFRDQVFEKIANDGIGADKIRVNGRELVKDNTLAPTVLFTNIQKVGALKELQVVGETLLDETVYVSNKRLGINTMDPSFTLDVWDQEVEIAAGKLTKDAGVICVPRAQYLVLGSNKNHNLILNPDGSVSVEMLKIGKVSQSSALKEPTADVPKGHIVWNADPKIGSPIGWVSLGSARWAHFGEITA